VEHDFHVGEIEDIREPVALAARGKVLEPLTLAHVAQALSHIRYLHSTLNKISTDFPVIWDIAKNIIELRSLEKSIDNCISVDGEIQDSASEHLSSLRQQTRNKRHTMLTNLESFVRSPGGQKSCRNRLSPSGKAAMSSR